MALIGEMQYLTIGDNTYSLPSGGSNIDKDTSIPALIAGTAEVGDTVGTASTNVPTTKAVVDYIDLQNFATLSNTIGDVRKDGISIVENRVVNLESENFVVNISWDNDKDGYVADKTYSQILQAYNKKKNIFGFNYYGSYIYYKYIFYGYDEEEQAFIFECMVDAGTCYRFYIYNNNNVDFTSSIAPNDMLFWFDVTRTDTFYPLVGGTASATNSANTLNGINFYQYYNTAGGYRRLNLGNTTNYTSSGGAYGTIRLYGTGATYYGDLNPGTIGSNSLTANRTWTLPDKTGTIALTSDIPTVPTITLNGSSTTSPSFYAPTGAGTSGYVLTSNGSGAPSWSNATATPTASTISKFDSSAKMNSTNMTSSEVTDFVESLDLPGGGGGTTAAFTTATATLSTSGWSSNTQTITVSGVTNSNIVIANPAPASYDEYVVNNVRCTGQDTNELTFSCDFVPSGAITVNIMIANVVSVYNGEVS